MRSNPPTSAQSKVPRTIVLARQSDHPLDMDHAKVLLTGDLRETHESRRQINARDDARGTPNISHTRALWGTGTRITCTLALTTESEIITSHPTPIGKSTRRAVGHCALALALRQCPSRVSPQSSLLDARRPPPHGRGAAARARRSRRRPWAEPGADSLSCASTCRKLCN